MKYIVDTTWRDNINSQLPENLQIQVDTLNDGREYVDSNVIDFIKNNSETSIDWDTELSGLSTYSANEVETEKEMNKRKLVLAQLAEDAKANPLIPDDDLPDMYYDMARECDVYKYTGVKDKLIDAIDNELENNTLGHKTFLETFINPEQTIRVVDVIKSRL